MTTQKEQHSHHPLWIAGLGPVATCREHFWEPLRPHPITAPRVVKAVSR